MTRRTFKPFSVSLVLSCLPVFLIKTCLFFVLMTLCFAGCGEAPAPVQKEAPSLDSADAKERSEAARKAAEDYGAK
jgi:hypothetical protein